MHTKTTGFKRKYFAKNKTRQLLLLSIFILLSSLALATSVIEEASSKNAAAANVNKIALSQTTPQPSSEPFKLSTTRTYAWGHNTKYSTILFDQNIIVKESTQRDIKYPQNADYKSTIIGIYLYVIAKVDSAIDEFVSDDDDYLVDIVEGGIGSNFTTVRFVSNALHDVQINLKIFGVDI